MVKKGLKTKCREVEMDLTDYVIGDATFLTKEKQEALFEHLRTCKECRKQFWSWKETWAVLVAQKQSQRPEFRARMDALLERFRKETHSAAPKKVDSKWEIGSAAGKIYRLLKANGEMSVPEIRQKTGLVNYPFYEAVGWLAKEEMVVLNRDDKTAYETLLPRP